MKNISNVLKAFLASNNAIIQADLYKFSCTDGMVFYLTSFARDVIYQGHRYSSLGPRLSRGTIKWQQGIEVQELDVQLAVTARDIANYTLNYQSALRVGAWDGAQAALDRVYFSVPPLVPSEVQGDGTFNADTAGRGGINLFTGRVAEVDVGPLTIAVKLHSTTELLNIQMPRHVWQPDCHWSLYDTGCTLDPAPFTVSGAVQANSTTTRVYLPDFVYPPLAPPPPNIPNSQVGISPLPLPPGWLNAGKIAFTTGRLAGLSRSVAFYQPSGTNTYQRLIYRDQPLAYWPFGADANDTGRFQYNGVTHGTVTFNRPSIVSGAGGGSTQFDGATSYITFPTLKDFLQWPMPLLGGFTIEFWVQPAVSRLTGIFDTGNSTKTLRCFDYGTNTGGIEISQRNPIISPLLVAQNIAHHVVIMVAGGIELDVYVDNFLVGQNPASIGIGKVIWQGLIFGKAGGYSVYPTEYYAGYLQSVAIYPQLLNETQIAEHFIAGTTVPSTVPVAYVDLMTPLPFAPQTGNLLTATAGCDLSRNQCQNKFNNLLNLGAQPTIPSPESVLNLGG